MSIILVIFLKVCAWGQNRQEKSRILFRGVVIDAESGERLGGSQVYINGLLSAASRDDGTFSFFALKDDTVRFARLGYKPRIYIIPDTLRTREVLTCVFLSPDTIGIGEVLIIPKLPSLSTVMMQSSEQDRLLDNARNNISAAAYQGRTGQNKLGDPSMNYELLRQKQKVEAYERGGIPSDRIAGISPFMLLPAAYLLIHGLPEKPEAPEPQISGRELEELNRLYKESLRKGRN
ncbi:MAG: carboxypeptidase-like regulatory domain-containing protein [Bacteroidales bacterium]|nr:carboxypeptidase-like regulatory domain-containing protein [Bacteroidales bacterium]